MGTLYRIVHEDPPRLASAGWLTRCSRPPWPRTRRALADGAGARLPRGGPLAAPTHTDETGTRTTTVLREPAPRLRHRPRSPPGDGTQVLGADPRVPPPAARPFTAEVRVARSSGCWAALVVVLLFLLFAWLFGAFDGRGGRPTPPARRPVRVDAVLRGLPLHPETTDPEARAEADAGLPSPTTWPQRSKTRRTSWPMLTPGLPAGQWRLRKVQEVLGPVVLRGTRQHRCRRRDTGGVSYTITYDREDGESQGSTTSRSSSSRAATALISDGVVARWVHGARPRSRGPVLGRGSDGVYWRRVHWDVGSRDLGQPGGRGAGVR